MNVKLIYLSLILVVLSSCNKGKDEQREITKQPKEKLTVVEYLNASGIPAFEITAVAQDVSWAHKKAESNAKTLLDRAIEGRMKQLLSPCPKPFELKFNSEYKVHWLEEKVELKGEVEAYFHGSVALSPYLLDTLMGQVVEQSSEFKACLDNWRSGEFVLQKSLWNAL